MAPVAVVKQRGTGNHPRRCGRPARHAGAKHIRDAGGGVGKHAAAFHPRRVQPVTVVINPGVVVLAEFLLIVFPVSIVRQIRLIALFPQLVPVAQLVVAPDFFVNGPVAPVEGDNRRAVRLINTGLFGYIAGACGITVKVGDQVIPPKNQCMNK